MTNLQALYTHNIYNMSTFIFMVFLPATSIQHAHINVVLRTNVRMIQSDPIRSICQSPFVLIKHPPRDLHHSPRAGGDDLHLLRGLQTARVHQVHRAVSLGALHCPRHSGAQTRGPSGGVEHSDPSSRGVIARTRRDDSLQFLFLMF